jgi:hypothetical protein
MEYPQQHTVDIQGLVVVALDVASVPPTCLDTLGISQEPQATAAPGQSVLL